MGCHPTGPETGQASGTAGMSFYCDDIVATVETLKAKGVEFTDEPTDRGYGIAAHFKMPGGFEVEVYEPRYTKS